jgi:N,N'-diacetyllegionaminate synthase
MKHSVNEEEVEKVKSSGHWGKPLIWKDSVQTHSGFELGVSGYDTEEFLEPKTHDDEEAIYIIEGEGMAKIGEHELAFKKGDALYIPPKTPHCIKKKGKGALKAVYAHAGFSPYIEPPTPCFIGKDEVFIIAEIGGNHEGNFEYAKKLLMDAASTGVHAVKFQTYKADKIVSKVENEARHKHFKKFELTLDQYKELAALAKKHKVMFMSSLWDEDAIADLGPYMTIHKVGSGDLTNYPLLEIIAKKNKPLIMSTAMTTLEEVKHAVDFINKVNPSLIKERKLVLLHCVAMYGEPKDEFANLQAMRVLQHAFPYIPIGYSDHTAGVYACELAIGMGASVIEKHFTDDKTREFRDHHLSANVEEMKNLVQKAKQIKKILGHHHKKPVESIETPERIKEFRRAVYLKQDAKKGTKLAKAMLITLRPNVGIDARKFYDVLGKKLKKDKKALEAIFEEDLE